MIGDSSTEQTQCSSSNANNSQYSNMDATCQHCTAHPEILPHVVYHCPPHIVQIGDWHNSIVQQLTNAICFGKITTDWTIAESNLCLRPDVVVRG